MKAGDFVTIIRTDFCSPIFGKIVKTGIDNVLVKVFGDYYWFPNDAVKVI
jgi:hypothetical protein